MLVKKKMGQPDYGAHLWQRKLKFCSKVLSGSGSAKKKGSQCLKIIEKVSFNFASEASKVFILSGQKFIKNAKNGQFCEFLKN